MLAAMTSESDSSFSVRIAVPEDTASVGEVLAVSFPKLLLAGYDPILLSKALPLLIRPQPQLLASGRYYVAESGSGRMVGCGGWSKERPDTREASSDEAHLRHFATHPDWLRCGVGRALLSRCFKAARAEGVRTLMCYSTFVAVEFYRAAGFIELGPLGLAAPLPGVIMRYDFD